MRDTILGESGQAVTEFTVMIPLLVLVVFEMLGVLHALVRRTECVRDVFESTRSALEGDFLSARRKSIQIHKGTDGVWGRKKCGVHVESLFLPYLDKRKPGASRSRFF